jgi:hypothetical protein
MNDFPHFYPSSPRNVPVDLAEPTAPFRKQFNVVACSVLLFFLLYFGLILMLALAIVYCVTSPDRGYHHTTWGTARWLFAVVLAVPLAILVKNLFGKQRPNKGYEVEVFERDHPDLFDFLQCICEETGAPMPDRVLINFQVNAGAGCEVSLITLVKPPKRMLILGLGLINFINMTEFKALLAHEFGHLSQQNMKSGPYVRVAIQVIFNILNATRHKTLQK